MGYIKVFWPDSQYLMDIEPDEMDEHGIEYGEDCSFFVPEDEADWVFEQTGYRI